MQFIVSSTNVTDFAICAFDVQRSRIFVLHSVGIRARNFCLSRKGNWNPFGTVRDVSLMRLAKILNPEINFPSLSVKVKGTEV